MRCYICDWSSTGEQSIYHETLQFDSQDDRYLLRDSQGRDICSHCQGSVNEALDKDILPFNHYEAANDNEEVLDLKEVG